MENSSAASLVTLPDEVILRILEFCDLQTLGRFSRTCKKFKQIAYSDCCWRGRSRLVLVSNMNSSPMQKRSRPNLSMKKRCEVSYKWRKGLSRRTTIIKYARCLPWIWLEQNQLFCSNERVIVQLPRREDGNLLRDKMNVITPHTDDVDKFAINENEVVTAGRDGIMGRWKKTNLKFIQTFRAHENEIHCVDAKNDIIVSGSRDETIKIWRALPKNTVCGKEINMGVRVLSVAIMPSYKHFIAGLPGTRDIHPLQLFDIEKSTCVATLGETFRVGAGILDIYPEYEHTFLSCGYDTTVKLWDLRAPDKHVAEWMDPYDNGIYCVKSDHNVTIVSGANRNGVVHLWDKRLSRCQYLFHIREYNSPAYSVAFDASHLFVAFDKALLQLSYLFPC